MEIKEIKEKEVWENFQKKVEEKTFLHSWAWGNFQKETEGKIWRFGFYKNSELISVALVVKIMAKRGKFLLIPHGPIVLNIVNKRDFKFQIIDVLVCKLKEIAKKEKISFLRINSVFKRSKENIEIFEKAGFRNAPLHIHPEATWQLDIRPKEDDILKNMRKTTRYLIRKAIKNKDIEIVKSKDIKDIEIFSKIHKEVSDRQNFIPFSKKYLEKEFLAFKKEDQISLFLGKYKGEIIASSFFIFYSGKAFYHHAALRKEYSNIPISYLLLWEAIKDAKKMEYSFFDFWGYVSPKDEPRHPWAGPTLFKMGFGGENITYLKTQDFPFSYKYWSTYFFEKLRKTKRRL